MYTGSSSMHIAIDLYSKQVTDKIFEKKTHCVIVFVAIDEHGESKKVPKWEPTTQREKEMEEYAIKLMNLRKNIEEEMSPFMK